MRKRLPIIVRVLLALALVVSLVAITAGTASAQATTLGASSGYPGQGITGNGSGWAPGSTITILLNGAPVTTSPPAIYVGTGTAPYGWASGTWIGSFVVPTIPGGAYSGVNGLIVTDGASTSTPVTFTVTQTAAVQPTAGPVGTSVTITGKGFKDGSSASVTLAGNPVVTSPYPIPVAADGTLSGTMLIPETASAGANEVLVNDGAGNTGNVTGGFTVLPSLAVIPNTGLPGSAVTALGTHFTDTATYRIAFQNVYITGETGTVGTVTASRFTDGFTVPLAVGGSPTTPGAKTVRAYIWTGTETPATATEYADATYTVQALPLTITPATGSSYSTVTIQGAGFTASADLYSVTLGGTTATNISGSVDTAGQLTGTAKLPMKKGGTHVLAIRDKGLNGTGGDGDDVTRNTTYIIPAAAMTLNPATGPEGTSITVSGTNFVPTASAAITIAGTAVGSATVSSAGTFSVSVIVPSGVIPGSNVVMATDTYNTAMSTFTVPGAAITLSPSSGYSGMTIEVSGVDFPAYSSVQLITFTRVIGGAAAVTPIPAPGVGADGTVTASFIVPASAPGIATVVLTAGGISGAGTFIVSAAAATPATVFATLEAGGLLVRVWALDAPTQTWLMYDPAALVVSDLAQLVTGQGYYVKVTADCTLTFGVNTYSLYAGWNLIGWLG